MRTMELVESPERTESMDLGQEELDRRIAEIMHVKALCGKLRPARERHFSEMIRLARDGAASIQPANRIAASSILDMVALEVCDE